ncbi:regulator of microtubule dynamics protein 1-like [Oppia nitens]|uniref:regulator of microtubule dynamics protein 1-like n=1 Tax=Oppia nitens TaxID=1686743 RepID=UPI0023DC7C2A|nr:regulator of microtubule dynamics protein 1-like [Oppia nitens]
MMAKEVVLKYLQFFKIIDKTINFQRVISKTKNLTEFAKYGNKSVILSTILSKYRNIEFTRQLMSIAITFPFVVKAWGSRDHKLEEKQILEEMDRLFDENEFDKLYEILKSQPSWYDNHDVLWRVARCEFHLSKRETNNSKDAIVLLEEAHRHVIKAIELCDECGPAHKWAAILLNAVSSAKGTREKIQQVLNVRTHMEKAIKYSPNDPTAHYLLGEWHYSCNQVSWIERKVAAAIYGSLPEANLEVGLQALEKAEELDSDFYSKNKVLIAKTLIALNRDTNRAKSLMIAVIGKYKNSKKWDDIEAVKEAKEELNKLGVKVTEINVNN